MTRFALGSFALAAAVLAPLAACVNDDADAPMVILRNVVPTSGCVIDPENAVFITSGRIQSTLDEGRFSSGYLFTPSVRNDLVLFEGELATPKTIFLRNARVLIDFADPTLFTAEELAAFQERGLTRFMVPLSGSLEPGGGTVGLAFEIVPRQLLDAIGAKLTGVETALLDVQVQITGKRAGGDAESNIFHYPVEVCLSCLDNFVGECASLPEGFQPSTGGACNSAQDVGVDCCTDEVGQFVCPAQPPPGS
jgi:hypothetical protein